MRFMVETGPGTGVKRYVCRKKLPKRGIELRAILADAIRFETLAHAQITRSRFSSEFNLIITQVKE